MRRLTTLPSRSLPDKAQEEVRRDHHGAIVELQSTPFARAKIFSNVKLEDGVSTVIPHGFGRPPLMIIVSPVRGSSTPGRIVEDFATTNRATHVKLVAADFGETVYVDVAVL